MIHVEGIGKRYQLGVERHDTLWSAWAHRARRMLSGGKGAADKGPDHFWALRDVSFDVTEGEVVGIIGRNGAGKSTLLKILSRITPPTEGRIRLKGRVASLLEVGTGFHPEMTGRENIFLNGAILGMSRREIKAKFDEIVAFSEVEKFIDTAVKHYSSGMYVRLAFAVAAHLDPEILIVDEVLAVGDAEFQRKCLGKMGDVARGGRTVLFVSHNMAAVRQLCSRAIVMRDGRLVEDSDPDTAIRDYLGAAEGLTGERTWDVPEEARVAPVSIAVKDGDGLPVTRVMFDQPVVLEVVVSVAQPTVFLVGVRITNHMGVVIFSTSSTDEACRYEEGSHMFRCQLPQSLLAPGRYAVTLGLHEPGREVYFLEEDVVGWEVEETGSKMARYAGRNYGVVIPPITWDAPEFVERALGNR